MIFRIFILLACLLPATAHAQNAPTVVEIYTSTRCPSCPKADHNFNQFMKQNPNAIGLSCHVTYFNNGIRNDMLSQKFCNARQMEYNKNLDTGGTFTPLVVVNGQKFTTGVKPNQIENIVNNRETRNPHKISLVQDERFLNIDLPKLKINGTADIWMVESYKIPPFTDYKNYPNSVKSIVKLLNWDGSNTEMAFPIRKDRNTKLTVIAQTSKNGIIAIGQAR